MSGDDAFTTVLPSFIESRFQCKLGDLSASRSGTRGDFSAQVDVFAKRPGSTELGNGPHSRLSATGVSISSPCFSFSAAAGPFAREATRWSRSDTMVHIDGIDQLEKPCPNANPMNLDRQRGPLGSRQKTHQHSVGMSSERDKMMPVWTVCPGEPVLYGSLACTCPPHDNLHRLMSRAQLAFESSGYRPPKFSISSRTTWPSGHFLAFFRKHVACPPLLGWCRRGKG